MARRRIRSVAVLGGGPAGAYLAAELARAGVRVALYTRGKRPPIIVGESLVPAIIPFLRRLGVEDEVRGFSVYKPGATFTLDHDDIRSFTFAEVRGAVTSYSYNVPRDRFDAALLEAALRAGARRIAHGAAVEREGDGDRVRLSPAALAAAGDVLEGPPDLIVDAGGRARQIANLLELPYETGARRDAALHAHLEGVPLLREGDVHTDRLERGWAWRIPLPGRVSVGLVIDGEHLRKFGDGAEEQFDTLLRSDRILRTWGSQARRLTPVVKYSNYQLASLRGVGENWALAGDAFGFVDPVFSSGLLVAFDGAQRLADAILDGSSRAFARYERHVIDHLRAWRRVVSYYYDGRLFTLFKMGDIVQHTPMGRLLNWHFQRHLPRVFTGEATMHRYSRGLLDFMVRYGLIDTDPRKLEVH
jgi:flavin-dependent dehydrogenase